MKRLKHAFAVDPTGVPEPTPEQRAVIDGLCQWLLRRRMTTPGLAFLGMLHPLNYLISQFLVLIGPAIRVFTERPGHKLLAEFLEKRGSVEYICRRIEELEEQAEQIQRQETSAKEQAESGGVDSNAAGSA